MKEKAIIITAGLLDDIHAKTAHGLIRGSDRFEIVGVIDKKFPGRDAGDVLDSKHRGIPVFSNVSDFVTSSPTRAVWCIIGVATKGGVIPTEFRPEIAQAIKAGMGIVSGLHHFVGNDQEFTQLAKSNGVKIVDVRKPRPVGELKFWTGRIQEVDSTIIPVLGTDCALGKRTTAMFLRNAMREQGYNAHMVYTGQTGWMLGNPYGFIFDATPNDFVSGELEDAILRCYDQEKPDVIFLEGQSGLRNPSGPCGSEFIISARADGVILVHNPERKKFKGMDHYPVDLPTLKDEIELIRILGASTLGVALNTKGIDLVAAQNYQQSIGRELGIPVALPLEEGVTCLMAPIVDLIERQVALNKNQ